MGRQLFKYVGASYSASVFASPQHVVLKCGYPRSFNDPYELFLTVDRNADEEALAYYQEAIGELPQLPTTCFSRTPASLPMWAHYAEELKGCVVAFHEEALRDAFPASGIYDVDYRDEPDPRLNALLHRAYATMKPRHTYFLQRAVMSAAYRTKATCWNYEAESRMVLSSEETRSSGDLTLIDIPKECVSALICGPRAGRGLVSFVQAQASRLDCGFFGFKIGRSSPVPYFVDDLGNPFIHSEGNLVEPEFACTTCLEPMKEYAEACSWCRITEEHLEMAAQSNPFRILSRTGLLDSYIGSMASISRSQKVEQEPGDV